MRDVISVLLFLQATSADRVAIEHQGRYGYAKKALDKTEELDETEIIRPYLSQNIAIGVKKTAEMACRYVTMTKWFTPWSSVLLRSKFTTAKAQLMASITETIFHSEHPFISTIFRLFDGSICSALMRRCHHYIEKRKGLGKKITRNELEWAWNHINA